MANPTVRRRIGNPTVRRRIGNPSYFWEETLMNPDPASLDNLRDIVELAPVPWWPPAPGWWVLLTLAVVASSVVALRVWRAWRAGAYRRAALSEVASATQVAAIADVLKRTALVAYPRTEVASLSGSAWSEWLAKTGGRQVPAAVVQALTLGVFAKHDAANVPEVTAFPSDWIRYHAVRRTDC